MIINNITELIGNTPILKIDNKITGLKNINLFVKCELFNPFGSIKDRTAYALIKDEIADLKKNNKIVIESSSGNTAKALQVICSTFDIQFKTITNRIKIPEQKDILKLIGADIEELPGLSECPDPTDPNDPITYINNIVTANSGKYYHTSQYTNLNNPKTHFEHTGKEIYNDLGQVDYFFGVLGTTGSTRGIVEYLLTKNPNLKKIGIIAEKGDTIPGIRNRDEMHEVGIFDSKLYDEIIEVSSMKAVDGMLTLNRKLGLLAGPTSGGSFIGTLEYLKKIDSTINKPITAVFVACDRVEWYMSYIKKRRPDIFDESKKVDSIRTLTDNDLENAKSISINDIQEFIIKHNPIIIDLRGSLAYSNGHIENSINITDIYFDDIVENGFPFDAGKIILLICAVGDKSKKYSAFLNKKQNGKNVYSLDGGIVAYRDKSLPLVRNIKKINIYDK